MSMFLQVIVHGLPFHYAWQELKDLFKPVGGVGKADIVIDRDGRSKGWGTVIFDSENDAQKAIQVCLQTNNLAPSCPLFPAFSL